MSLITLAELKVALGNPTTDATQDAFLQGEIDLYSEIIESYCARKFIQSTYTQQFYRDDFPQDSVGFIRLYHWPVTIISSIQLITRSESGDTTETLTANSDYRFHNTGKIKRLCNYIPRTWDGDFGSSWYASTEIQIDYTAGFLVADVPLPIKNTMYAIIDERWRKYLQGQELNFGKNVQRMSVPGVISIDYDYTLTQNERERKFGMFLGDYANALDFYRSDRALIGNITEPYVT